MGKKDPAFPVLENSGSGNEILHLGMNQLTFGAFLLLQGMLQNEKLMTNLHERMKREKVRKLDKDGMETVVNPPAVTAEELRAEVARQAVLYAEEVFYAVTAVGGDSKL